MPRRVTRADKALTDMQQHLDWLRAHRSAEGSPHRLTDITREIGLTEAMDILRRHGARLVEDGDDV